MPTLIKLLEIELSSALTKRYSISGWPVTYDSNVYDNDGTFVGLGDLKFSLELENNPFEVTLHLSDQDVLDAINAYSYRFRDATLIIGEWNGTMIDQSTVIIKKGFIDTHSDPSADFTVDFTISSYLELASKQRGDIAASSAHAIKLKDGVFGDDNKTTIDTIFDKANNDWNYVTLGRSRAGSVTTQIGGGRPCSNSDHLLNNDPVYQTTQIPESAGVRIANNGETFHTPVAYGRTKLNYQLVNAWNPTPAAVAIAYPTITWDEEDFDPLVLDETKYITMVFAVCHGPIEKLEVYNATNDSILMLLDNGNTSATGSIRRTSVSTTSLAVLDVVNNGENNVALAKSVTASAGAYTTNDRGIGYTLVHITAIASGFWESGIPDLTFIADSTHIRPLTSAGVSPTRSGVNGSGEVMYDYLSSRQYGLGLSDEYLDADSFYDFQANSLDIYPDNLRGSVTGSGSFLKFLERMQQSCAARIYEESGVVKLWYGDILDNSDIKKEFKDNGLSNTNCIITQQNPRSRSVFNEVTGKYFAIFDASDQPPDNIQKTVVISNTDYLTEDNGIKSTTSFDMDFLTLDADGDGFVNPADEQQINEIVNLVLQKSRLFQEVEITTSYDEASGLNLGDLIRCEVSRYGWEVADRRLFFIREIIYTADGNVSIIGQRHSNTVYGGVDSFTNIDVENIFPVRLDGLNSLDSYLTTGPQGPQGRFQLTIYIRATSEPATPTGGSYVASTDTLTPPTNWFTTIGDVPDADGDIYFSVAVYDPATDPDTITPTWSVPAQAGTTGPTGSRGSGDWHYRVGETLKGTYSDEELSGFLAMVVPGTDQDAPLQGDRLWIFASPSDDDQSVTEQQVYIWVGNTWDNQAAAIDGNLLVSGTVTADNVVADISITAPAITGGVITGGTITGGFIQGSFISAGIIRSQIFAFPINQNTDTSIFVDLDEKRRAFLRQDNENPSRNTITQKFSSAQNASSLLSFTASDRFLNVNQDIPLTAVGYQEDPDLLRRNWYTHVPYSLSAIYAEDEVMGGFDQLSYSMVFPSCVFSIIDGNDNTVDTFTLPRQQAEIVGINTRSPTYTLNSPLNGSGRFSDFQMYHSGTMQSFVVLITFPSVITRTVRSNMGISCRGFIHLQDDEHIEVTIGSTAITGSAIGVGVDGEQYSATLTAYNVGLETDFNSKANYYFDINDSTQTDGADTAPVNVQKDAGTEAIPQNVAIPQQSFINDNFDYDPIDSKISIARVSSELIEGAIDASQTEILNIVPENIISGDLSGVSSTAGTINFQPSIPLGQTHTLNEIIDAYQSGSSGIGYNLSYNSDTEKPLFAIGDFDDNDPDAWVATNDYLLGDFVTSVSLYYTASEDITGAAANTAPATDTDRWDLIELPRNSNMFYTPNTGLVIGGTITAGSVRGGDLLSSDVPTGTESGTYIDLDGGTFVFGNAQENLQYDGTNITLSGIPIDGELIINNSIDGNKLNVNTVIARTIRSDNYVAPVLADNPPVMGYSLEHVEGIGFFEEIRADLTGTVTAPSQTPSQGTFLYNTSAVTTEYLNITEGDTLDDFVVDVEGDIQVFKGILSDPMWELTLPTNLESNASALFPTNFFAGSRITNGAAYDWYTNLSVNNTTVPFSIVPIWFGYDSNDNIIGEIGYFANLSGPNFVGDNNSVQIPAAERSITSSSAVDTADQIDSLIANAGGVQLGVEIPVTAKLHMIFVSQHTTSSTSLSLRPGDTSPISITGGFRANSSMQFNVKSSDGTAQTTTITQNIP